MKQKNAYTEIDLEFSFINPDLHYPFPSWVCLPQYAQPHARPCEQACEYLHTRSFQESKRSFIDLHLLCHPQNTGYFEQKMQVIIYIFRYYIFLANNKNQSI